MCFRYGSKKKIDKALKEDLAELKISSAASAAVPNGDIKRVRMDIRHCYLPKLPGVNSSDTCSTTEAGTTGAAEPTAVQPVVVIAKHLCGVATDLAIQSVHAFPHVPKVHGAAKLGTVQ